MENLWWFPKTPFLYCSRSNYAVPRMRAAFRESSEESLTESSNSKQNNPTSYRSSLPDRESFDPNSTAGLSSRAPYVPLVEPGNSGSITINALSRCAVESSADLNEQKLQAIASVKQMNSKKFAEESSDFSCTVDGLINEIHKSLLIEETKLPTPSSNQVAEVAFHHSRGCTDVGKVAFDFGSKISARVGARPSTSWVAVEASAPKPNFKTPPPVRILQRTDPLPGSARESISTAAKDRSKPFSATRSEKRLRRARQYPRRMKQQLLAEERREQLLSRFRRTLEASAVVPTVAVGATQSRRCVRREFPKPKRLTRLKAGIVQDRIRRRALGQATAAEMVATKFLPPSMMEKTGLSTENADSTVVPELLTTFSTFVEQEVCSVSEGVAKSKGLSHVANEKGEYETVRVALPNAVTVPKSRIIEKVVLVTRPDLEESVKTMVSRLADFHDRSYKQTADSQAKRINNRRIVCGFHEVIKSLKLNRLMFLVVAKDLEKGAFEIEEDDPRDDSKQDKGASVIPPKSNALAKTLKQAVDMAKERNCPVMLAFKRRQLQRMCHKGAPVSCVGVINCAGAEDIAKDLIEQFNKA